VFNHVTSHKHVNVVIHKNNSMNNECVLPRAWAPDRAGISNRKVYTNKSEQSTGDAGSVPHSRKPPPPHHHRMLHHTIT
jgi:hypothetical protein